MDHFVENYLVSVRKQFEYYKMLGEKTFIQLTEEQLLWQYNPESNSIAIIVNHISGNMLSRWTNFLTEDGEKEWRNREQEFKDHIKSEAQLKETWEKGWSCLFKALDSINEDNVDQLIYIRNMGHSIAEAINRQLAHYSYHLGQIVYLGRMIKGSAWQSLSIPKGESSAYNKQKFAQAKQKKHFTDEYLNPDE